MVDDLVADMRRKQEAAAAAIIASERDRKVLVTATSTSFWAISRVFLKRYGHPTCTVWPCGVRWLVPMPVCCDGVL